MKYQLLPELSAADYETLKRDIAARGVMVPVEYDQEGSILDGHHRIRACQELGIGEWPQIVRAFRSEEDKRTHVRQLNLARRHLTQQQRRELIADELRDQPERSNRQVASALGVDDKTVGAVRETLIATAEIPQLERTIGADGKFRKRPKLRALDFGTEGQGVTVAAATKIRARKAEIRHAQRIAKLTEISNANAPLPQDRKYPIVLADPAWKFRLWGPDTEDRAAEYHYPCMETPEICKIPVPATPDAVLFLWVPGSCLSEAFEVLEAWGFEYVTNLVWIKNVVGLGNWVRNQHELLLICRRGEMPAPLPANRPASVIQAPRREHSQKPDEAYELIEAMYPDLPKIELFARNVRPGWSAWGNEVKAA